ncbi:MAG TPA: hypothetical protein VJ579_05125 [Candidatus Paceibacterota bacterium]|nr:hypothetical protein [Candidatus Paceibacterota bacterium]
MQDKHTDLHFMMVAALVLVAASAIFQTAIGLSADKLSAAQSQRMFATVVAASGSTANPKVEQYAKQMRSVEVNDNGRAKVRGIVKSVASRGISVQTWGGEWKVVISAVTKVKGQQGKLDAAAIKEGDYVFIEGIAENSGAPVIAAQAIVDYTLYRSPGSPEAAKRATAPVLPIAPVSAPMKAVAAPEQTLSVTPPGVVEVISRGDTELRKEVMQKSIE